MIWHLVTGEYPPACGGVGDYTADLARALALAGDTVHVWAPASDESIDGVIVHELPDRFGRGSRQVLAEAWAAQAYVEGMFDWDWTGAEREMREAIAIAKLTFSAPLAATVVMPISLPRESTSAPPELPGLIAASVWMRFVSRSVVEIWTVRPVAEMIPVVTVLV